MKIKKGDKVMVIAGKDKGKTGTILQTFPKLNKVVVEGLNLRTKFVKKSTQGPGQQVQFPAKLDASNVMFLDGDKPSRLGFQVKNDKKVRIAKKSNKVVE